MKIALKDSKTEVKLKLKKLVIGFDDKSIKNTDDITSLAKQYPQLSASELLGKCSNTTFGDVLPILLLEIQTTDTREKLKLYRWATKINTKMLTDKAELILDLNQVTELFNFINKATTIPTNTFAPIFTEFERLKEELTK